MILLLVVSGCATGSKTVILSTPVKEPGYDLRFKTAPNSTAAYSVTLQSRFAQGTAENENAIATGWRAVLTQRATTPDLDGSSRLAILFDSLQVEKSDPLVEPLLKPLEGIVGKSVQVLLQPSGEISRFLGLENLPAVANQNNQMETVLRTFFPRFAGHAVAIGEGWSRQDTIFNKSELADLTIINRAQYSLLAAAPHASTTQVKLHNSGSFSLSGITKNQGATIVLNGAGSTEADFVVDAGDGWLISASTITTASGTAEINANQATTIPWRSTTTINIFRK